MQKFYAIQATVGVNTVYARLTIRGLSTTLKSNLATPINALNLADAQARVKARAKRLAQIQADQAPAVPNNASLRTRKQPRFTVLTQPVPWRRVPPKICDWFGIPPLAVRVNMGLATL